ncbi:MAG: hypothetical protein V3T58_03320 [Candidatus Hydrothermarchaeales archaeon]
MSGVKYFVYFDTLNLSAPKRLTHFSVFKKYCINRLWNKFKGKDFGYEEASKVLKEKDKNLVSVVLSQLRKHGWLIIKLHPKDSRKRIYKLKSPEKAIEELKVG